MVYIIPEEHRVPLAKMIEKIMKEKPRNPTQQDLADFTDTSTSTISRLSETGEENDLFEVDRKGNAHNYTILKAGKDFFEEVAPWSEDWETSDEEYFLWNLHYTTVELPLSRPNNLPDDLKAIMVDVSEVDELDYWESCETLYIQAKGFMVRVTSEKAFVQFEDPFIGEDITELGFDLAKSVREVREWLQENTLLNFDDRFYIKFRVATQHIALENCPIHKFIDTYADIDVVDFEVNDESGEMLLTCDTSDGRQHTEFGGGNRLGGDVKKAEDIAQKVETLLKSVILDWEEWNRIIGLIEDGFLDGVYSIVARNSRRLLWLEKRVSELENKMDTTDGNDLLDSSNSDSNSLFIYWAKRLSIKPLITFSLEKEVIAMDDFEEVLRQKIQEEVKKQLGMFDTSQRRTENELKDLIQEELEMRPKTVTELRHALDANRSTVINQLEKLAEVDVVEEFEKDGNSYWRHK